MIENSVDAAKVWLRGYLDEKVRMESLIRVMDELNGTTPLKTESAQKLDMIIRHIHETLLALETMISRLENARQRLILTLRYLVGLRWDAIAKTMCYEGPQVFKIHRQALQEVQKLMESLTAVFVFIFHHFYLDTSNG